MTHFFYAKSKLLILAALAGISLGLVISYWQSLNYSQIQNSKPNILILSFCSLRIADLDASPVFDAFKKRSYFFTQAFSKHGWVNLFQYLSVSLEPLFFKNNGYELLGVEKDWPVRIIPPGQDTMQSYQDKNEEYTLDFKNELLSLKKQISQKHGKPFFSFIHFRYLHYPLIDRLNTDEDWGLFLDTQEKIYVQKLLANPKKHKTKLPFFLMLTGNTDLINNFPELKIKNQPKGEIFLKQYSLFSDQKYIKPWKQDHDYQKDILILRKIYRAKVRYFSEQISDLINLYQTTELQKNTLLIVVGDHGEALMEHDVLGHSFNIYDESIRVPLMIKFPDPGDIKINRIEDQFFIGSLSDFILKVSNGFKPTEELLREAVLATGNQIIVTKNCNKTEVGLRYNNQWKYIKDFSTGENQIYDLKNDPTEKHNIFNSSIDLAAKFDLILNQHLSDLNQVKDLSSCQSIKGI